MPVTSGHMQWREGYYKPGVEVLKELRMSAQRLKQHLLGLSGIRKLMSFK